MSELPPARKVVVAMYNRPGYESELHRKHLGHETFHWGILISPEQSKGKDCDAYDATDRNTIDPVTFRMENPTLKWWLNARGPVDPALSGKLLVRIFIGAVPHDKSSRDVKELIDKVPLPKKDQDPQQSCVTWVKGAIRAFQEEEWLGDLAVETFMDWALSYADRKRADTRVPAIVHYQDALEAEKLGEKIPGPMREAST